MRKIKLGVFLLGWLALGWGAGAGLENALDISASGVVAQRTRAEVAAENIANMDTTKTSDGLPYRRKVIQLRPAENFSRSGRTTRQVLNGVAIAYVGAEPDAEKKFQRIYKPGHPDADENGFVLYPNVNITEELVELSEISGAFENNVVVFNNTKAMMQASLELAQ
ncbi:flagellar basal body rod protein FlgC [Candidatus Termititenax persephonae]|uniref:Flagellar basal-body rod protein FlgC n=1 Tax=Candidatus Termititenax persephonae TaxID=2218525 RepID=A0A388TG06_9BACT|nr:flagellar basal body rod protein FlgC [Candidatus Termititenax persephonae]